MKLFLTDIENENVSAVLQEWMDTTGSDCVYDFIFDLPILFSADGSLVDFFLHTYEYETARKNNSWTQQLGSSIISGHRTKYNIKT